MRKVEQTIYRIDELPESAGRERAFNFVRGELVTDEADEISRMPGAINHALPKIANADDLDKAANAVGHSWAFVLADEYLARHKFHGAREDKFIVKALRGIAHEKIEDIEAQPSEYFDDAQCIEFANSNGYEFTEEGRFYA